MFRSLIIISIFGIFHSIAYAQNGWQSLFDGKTFNEWQKVAGEAKYEIADNAIVGITNANTPNTFLLSEKTYDDFILELEFKIDDEKTNSGIQFRSQYDEKGNEGKGRVYGYQYELDPSTRAWSAGIYDEGRRGWLYPLDLHANAKPFFKIGQYNKVRIECIGNVTQTFLNGSPVAVLVDDVDLNGHIALQVHSIGANDMPGKKIYWKDIRIKTEKLNLTPVSNVYVVNNSPNSLLPSEQKDGWQLLFDGVNTDQWRSAKGDYFPAKGWVVNDSELQVLPSNGGESTNGGDIITKKQYSAFDLSFQFKLSPGANSGVKYFVTLKEQNSGSAIGPEYQLLDDALHPDAKQGKNGNRTLASLYDLITSKKDSRFVKPIGEWNTGRIIATKDNKVKYFLNGLEVVSFVRGSDEFRTLVSDSKYKIWENFGEAEQGHILLQDHGDAVSFRSIKIRDLSNR